MELLDTVLAQGGLGIVAGVFLWLYLGERNDRKAAQKELADEKEARRVETKETATQVMEIVQGNTTSINLLTEKIEIGKRIGGGV